MTVFHIVLIQFQPTVNSTQIQDLCNDCIALKETCLHPDTNKPYLKSMALGKDVSIEGLNGDFTHAFIAEFDSLADRDYYVKTDPSHKDFVKKIAATWTKGHTIDIEPGKSLGKPHMQDNDEARRIIVDYTLAAVKVFNPSSATKKKFHFIYLSGGASERDQTKPLWFMQDYRRVRGQIENELMSFAKAHPDTFETSIMRPGFVLAKETNFRDLIRGLGPSTRVDTLATAMIRTALDGSKYQIVENPDIAKIRS
ncbi:hypothetical protein B7463_g10032, partial [Scytalidium lignicola]